MNKEKYRDPTAEKAIANVMKEYCIWVKKKQDGDRGGRKSERKAEQESMLRV